jgi:hypothetical protein
MPKKKPDKLETIDLGALDNVTGGRSSAAASGQNSRTDSNSQLMTLLTEISTELQSLTQNRNQDPFSQAMMLMQEMQSGNSVWTPGFSQFNAMKKGS